MLFTARDGLVLLASTLGIGGLIGLAAWGWRCGWAASDTRRAVHAGVGLFVAAAPWVFSGPVPLCVVAGAFVLVNAFARARGWWPSVHAARPSSWGTVALPLVVLPAAAATWAVSPERIVAFQAAFLVVAVADPLTSWAGEASGVREWVPGATVAGSAVFFCVSSVLTGAPLLAETPWPLGPAVASSVLAALVATAVEAIGRRGWDNFFIVLGIILVLVPLQDGAAALAVLTLAVGTGMGFGVAAYAGRALDARGAVGGGLFAASLVGLGGWAWALPGFVFFVLSSALSLLGGPEAAGSEGGDGRTLRQVLANGGVAWAFLGVFALAAAQRGAPSSIWYAGFLGALAAAAADTWATEVGGRVASRPWSLRACTRVPAGTSGAVSLAGSAAAAVGAGTVAAAAVLAGGSLGTSTGETTVIGVVAGLVGMTADSLAGAVLQARYRDPGTGWIIERPPHQASVPVRGWRGVDNEAVNLLGTTVGALVAIVLS